MEKTNNQVNVRNAFKKTNEIMTRCMGRLILNEIVGFVVLFALAFIAISIGMYPDAFNIILLLIIALIGFIIVSLVHDVSYQIIYDEICNKETGFTEQSGEAMSHFTPLVISKFILWLPYLPIGYFVYTLVLKALTEIPFSVLDYILITAIFIASILYRTIVSITSHGIMFQNLKPLEAINQSIVLIKPIYTKIIGIFAIFTVISQGLDLLSARLNILLVLLITVIRFIVVYKLNSFITLIYYDATAQELNDFEREKSVE